MLIRSSLWTQWSFVHYVLKHSVFLVPMPNFFNLVFNKDSVDIRICLCKLLIINSKSFTADIHQHRACKTYFLANKWAYIEDTVTTPEVGVYSIYLLTHFCRHLCCVQLHSVLISCKVNGKNILLTEVTFDLHTVLFLLWKKGDFTVSILFLWQWQETIQKCVPLSPPSQTQFRYFH